MDLTSPELHPLLLRRILDSKIPEWVSADSDTLWGKLRLIGVFSTTTKNKIQALRTVLRAPVLEDWRIFEDTVLALLGGSPNFQDISPPSYIELIGGSHILDSLLPIQFASDEILRYCAAVAMFRGVPELVPPLTGGNEYILRHGPFADEMSRANLFRSFLDTLLKEQEMRLEAI